MLCLVKQHHSNSIDAGATVSNIQKDPVKDCVTAHVSKEEKLGKAYNAKPKQQVPPNSGGSMEKYLKDCCNFRGKSHRSAEAVSRNLLLTNNGNESANAAVSVEVKGSVDSDGIFRNHDVFKNSAFSKTSNLDRLSVNESKMSSLRSHLPLTVTDPTLTRAIRSNSSRSDFRWLSGRAAVNSIKSPTFSMADIAVIVPPNITADCAEENACRESNVMLVDSPCQIISTNNKSKLEHSETNIYSDDDAACRDINEESEGNIRGTAESLSAYENIPKSTTSVLSSNDPLTDIKKTQPSNTKNKTFNNRKTGSVRKNSAEKRCQEAELNLSCGVRSLPTCKNANSNASTQNGCVYIDKHVTVDYNNDSNINLSLNNGAETEASEQMEWKYVESTRNKQKRRQARSCKYISTPLSVIPFSHANTRSTNPRKSSRNIKKPALRAKVTEQQPSKTNVHYSVQQPVATSLSSERAAASSKSTLVVEKSSLHSTDVMQVPAANENCVKSDTCTSLKVDKMFIMYLSSTLIRFADS